MNRSNEDKYCELTKKFRELFDQELSDDELNNKTGGIIGDEALQLGVYIWLHNQSAIEYYVSWLPHYRGDSHGIIYKNGKHELLATLPQIGKVTKAELELRAELERKGLI
ncbi:hypothetical protein C7H09_10840 [Marinobacter fuscus]|uniref:Uncharacterized protein n=1 Tax=Marinobacter fuscus TaxID=2109942 RepID=A0A2T1K8X3_9GAMM|nr:hypothetical protein [Marinobacter fuscus]PSF06223.1 hypothetical protein C7H09_10840 [Marinobacter fuscus]